MATFLAAVVVFAAAIVGMAVGVILNKRCLQGSCGGLNQLPDGSGTSVCGTCGTTAHSHDNEKHKSERVTSDASA
ncbi:MAG: hypothetical protein KDA78_19315 [Planctomycetaceae bacterium]|nr:hypothetical protein [Planctomycetaceae bacterium]